MDRESPANHSKRRTRSLLTVERFKTDELFLYTPKFGTRAYIPLRPLLVKMLRSIEPKHGRYFFAV